MTDKATAMQIAYNAGRGFYVKGWKKVCPYVPTSKLAPSWWKGWFDAEREAKKTPVNQ